MGTPKYLNFINLLGSLVEDLNTSHVKSTIGDSINNNRVLTVSQVIRFLESANGLRGSKKLARNLSNVYEFLRQDIVETRINKRTDAIDINEFIVFYTHSVIGIGEFREIIGRTLLVA